VTLKLGFGVTEGHRKLHHCIDRPQKPHPRTKHHVDRQTGCELMAMFVYPRRPTAAILDFIEPQIAPFENPSLEPNMEWIGCTVCEIFAFKPYCDLETGVRGHSRSSKVAPFDTTHATLYSFSTVTMHLAITVSEIEPHIVRKSIPPCIRRPPPLGLKPSDLRNDPR